MQLAEVTKHVGSVIYPESVPLALAQAAVQTGVVQSSLDETEAVGGFTFNLSSLFSPSLPFGIAAVSFIEPSRTPPAKNSFLHIPNARYKNGGMDFPRYPFSDMWQLVQEGESEKLARLFQGEDRVFALFVESSMSVSPSAAYLHPKLAHAYLTQSWLVSAPIPLAFLLTVILGWLVMVLGLSKSSLRRLGLMSGIIVILGGGLFLLGLRWGWLWPLFSMGLSVGLTIVGILAWKWRQTRSNVHQHIAGREQQLHQLVQELSEKQYHVGQLEMQLSEVQHRSNQSGIVIEELQIAQHTALSQLDQYQNEVQATRQRIERLHKELQDLRQHVPVAPEERSSEDLSGDDQMLIQECEAFQIVTRDQAVLRLFHNLKKAAATQVPILLLGETGTGKEIFAKAAHALSPRRDGPFISVNMAAIRAELFEGELFGHVKGAFYRSGRPDWFFRIGTWRHSVF